MAISSYKKRIEAIEKKLQPKPGQNGTLRFYKISAEDDFAEDQNLKKFDTIVWLPVKSDSYEPPAWNFYSPIIEDDTQDTETEPEVVKIEPQQNISQPIEDNPQRRGMRIEAFRWRTGEIRRLSQIFE